MKPKLFFLLLSYVLFFGCGGDDEILKETLPVANFVSANPPGGCIRDPIIVTFDNPPRKVSVNTGIVKVEGKIAIISGPFTPGPTALTITWEGGTQALNYSVDGFGCP